MRVKLICNHLRLPPSRELPTFRGVTVGEKKKEKANRSQFSSNKKPK